LIRTITIFLCTLTALQAETYTVTLRQAVDLALQQNPELIATRLDEQKANQSVRLARDPFYPRLFVGSGAAYSAGYPLTIDGNPPSIFQAHAVQTFFNRPKTYAIAEARENERTTLINIDMKRDDIAFRTASLYLDAERTTQVSDIQARQIQQFEQIAQMVSARVAEGKELKIEKDKAMLNLARAKQLASQFNLDRLYLERSLAIVLGYGPEDSVKISTNDRSAPDLPTSEQAAVDLALSNSKELKRLESALIAKGYAVKAQRASRLPQVDLVAQYSLLTRYNFSFFSDARFERNAGQIGISVQIPLLSGTGAGALAQQAEIESIRLREEIKSARGRISLDARRSFEELRNEEAAEEVARLDLAVTREMLDVALSKFGEGRATLTEVANLRTAENEKWITFFSAQSSRERARLNVLRQTGSLLSALR
jgi:outer membrane protein TolC